MSSKVLGDFQTPLPLVRKVLQTLYNQGQVWERALEPTCGLGNFIQGLTEVACPPKEIIGLEVQNQYVQQARSSIKTDKDSIDVYIKEANIFSTDLSQLNWHYPGKLLVVGNPPWVTNSMIGTTGDDNTPNKSNFKRLSGIQAITGSSNFDITEYIIIKVMNSFRNQATTIAFLCKTAVARNVLRYAQKDQFPLHEAKIYLIDAKQWFKASVDACLFTFNIHPQALDASYTAHLFETLETPIAQQQMGFIGETLIPDLIHYHQVSHLDGNSSIEWRQGVKHDAAAVMELTMKDNKWINSFGTIVDVENEYIFPLLKGSDLRPMRSANPKRAVIIPQKRVGEETNQLRYIAPRLWEYLNNYANIFAMRKSTIYRKASSFSIFGVGSYSFAPFKVMVSGLYKTPYFVPIVPNEGKPVFCDDTCYLLPLKSDFEAQILAAALNHDLNLTFIHSISFRDAKRPITKSILSRIDLGKLLDGIPFEEIRDSVQQTMSYEITSNHLQQVKNSLSMHSTYIQESLF